MGGKGGGTSTVETQSAPPAQFLAAYQNAQNQAQNAASVPYQSYPGQVVAQLSPDQSAGLGEIENLTANGGVQAPYIAAAQGDFQSATQPLLNPTLQSQLNANSGSALVPATASAVSGIQGAADTGTSGILGATGSATSGIQGAAGAGTGEILGATGMGASNILGTAAAGASGITSAAAGLTPASLSQWENPYTSEVVQATENQFQNQNAQQQAQVSGNAISSGAFGGDRSAVAAALTAGQEQLAQAPVIAGLESSGYTTALGAAQNQAALQTQAATSAGSLGLQGASTAGSLGLQGATSAGSLGLQGASTAGSLGLQGQSTAGSLGLQGAQAAGQAGMTGATTESQLGLQGAQVGLGANEANAWLASQAAFGEANLGSEAQSTGLTGANALLSAGGLEQQQAQENLNIPYEQYLAAQAYPFQTAGWEANIAEGLGGASGGTSSTTSPGPSVASQVGGLGLGALGLSQSGVFSGLGNIGTGISNLASGYALDGAATGATLAGLSSVGGMSAAEALASGLIAVKRGGGINGIPRRDAGGATGDVDQALPTNSWQAPLIQQNLDAQLAAFLTPPDPTSGMASGGMLKRASGGANEPTDEDIEEWMQDRQRGNQDPDELFHNTYGQHITLPALLPLKPPSPTRHAEGGMVPRKHFDVGGFSSSMESPWWARSEEREATDRHGLLASPIAGRTDKLAVNPATGSYVIPADVIAGLGEGNTLAGANVMQRMIETGPHGLRMPPNKGEKGIPRPPPAYREGEGDNGMATGGNVPPHYAAGGMSPSVTNYLADNGLAGRGLPSGNGTYTAVPGTGVNPSTGMGASNTGIPELDTYLNQLKSGMSFARPQTYTPPPAAPAAAPTTPDTSGQFFTPNVSTANALQWSGGPQARGGTVKLRADGGPADDDSEPGIPFPVPSRMGSDSGLPFEPDDSGSSSSGSMLHPHSDIAVDRGMGPPPPPKPTKNESGDSLDKYLSRFQTTKPDPWADLALAGFSMAAGRSPHALENIGAGAEKGLGTYLQQKQEQSKEGLQAGETAARLAGTQAYREGVLGNRDRSLDIKQAQGDALNQYRSLMAQFKAIGQSDTEAHQHAMEQLGFANLGVRQQQGQDRTTLGYANLAQRQEAQDALNQYRDALAKNRTMSTQETASWHAYMRQHHATEDDINLAKSFSPTTGKPNFPDPHAEGERLRQQNQPPAPTPAAPPTAAKPDLSAIWGN